MAARLAGQGTRIMTFRKVGLRHRAAAVSATCLALALLFYALSPVATLLSVANGLRHEDVAALRGALDWRAVRLGLKADFGGGLPVSLASAKVSSADDELPGFGESFANTLVSHVVDDEVTPERMMAMLSRGDAGGIAQGGAVAAVRSVLGRVERVAFLGPARFEAAIRMSDDPSVQPVCVSMRLEHWQWKITEIHLPEQMLQGGGSLVQSASNRT